MNLPHSPLRRPGGLVPHGHRSRVCRHQVGTGPSAIGHSRTPGRSTASTSLHLSVRAHQLPYEAPGVSKAWRPATLSAPHAQMPHLGATLQGHVGLVEGKETNF